MNWQTAAIVLGISLGVAGIVMVLLGWWLNWFFRGWNWNKW